MCPMSGVPLEAGHSKYLSNCGARIRRDVAHPQVFTHLVLTGHKVDGHPRTNSVPCMLGTLVYS